MKIFKFIIALVLVGSIFSSCTNEDARVEVTVLDVNLRPIPNATVTFYAYPGTTVIEDRDYSDADGKTSHKFVFEGTLNCIAEITNYSIYSDLRAQADVILTHGETFNLELILEEPIPVED